MRRYHAEARGWGLPLLLIGVAFGVMGWAASFTYVGAGLIFAGAAILGVAAIARPTWRFIATCLFLAFCVLGGPILVIAALVGD